MFQGKSTPATSTRPHSILRRFVAAYGTWTQKISGAIIDQAFFAGSNFVLNVLLARWMSIEEYGAFVVVYSWFLLAQNFYDAALVEPMAIFGAGKYSEHFREYLGFTYYGHLALAVLIAVLLWVGAVIAHLTSTAVVATALIGAGITAPLLLTRWLTRQPCYVLAVPQWSAMASALYFFLSIAGLLLLHEMGGLSAFTAMLTLGVTGFIASAALSMLYLRPRFVRRSKVMSIRGLLADHWDYGKWAVMSRGLTWIPSNIYYIILPLMVGLGGSATMRVLFNLILPVLMTLTAFYGLLVPSFVRTYHREGKAGLTRRVRLIMLIFLALTGVYGLFLMVLGKPLMNIIYGGRYDDAVTFSILVVMALQPVVASVQGTLDAALRSMGGVKQAFLANIAPALLTVTVGLALLYIFGIVGAFIANVVTISINVLILIHFYRRYEAVPDQPANAAARLQPVDIG